MSTIEKAIEKLSKKGEGKGGGATEFTSSPGVDEPRLPETGQVAPSVPKQHGAQKISLGAVEITPTLDELGMMRPGTDDIRLAEEYRRIKRPVLMNIDAHKDEGNSNLIMVTSSSPSEGKTFTSINLAVSIAMELDRTVLLVDADVHKPAASRILGVDEHQGLVDVLVSDNPDLSEVITKTDIPTLSVLPVGVSRENANELLSSNAMTNLMKELAYRYHDRVVILDTPPVLAANEAAIISNLVGQVVIVVEAEKTKKTMLDEALSAITLKNKSVGLVLNKSRVRPEKYSYYGSYAVDGRK